MTDLYERQITIVEALTFTYNNLLQRIANEEVDVEYFAAKAKEFKKNSPQAIEAQQTSLNNAQNLELDRMCLKIIERKLAEYKKKEKTK